MRALGWGWGRGLGRWDALPSGWPFVGAWVGPPAQARGRVKHFSQGTACSDAATSQEAPCSLAPAEPWTP